MDPITAIFINLAILIVTAVISRAIAPRPKAPEPPAIQGFGTLPTVGEGRPVPVVFGTVWIDSPALLWWGDTSTQEIRKTIET